MTKFQQSCTACGDPGPHAVKYRRAYPDLMVPLFPPAQDWLTWTCVRCEYQWHTPTLEGRMQIEQRMREIAAERIAGADSC